MSQVGTLKDTPAGEVLNVLLRKGPQTVKELQEALGLSSTAVRLHLHRLQSQGYIEPREERRGVGRPVKVYHLTEKARTAMGSHSESLALTLLEEMLRLEGPEKVRVLLDRVSTRLADDYGETVRSSNLYKRIQELAQALERRGILADVIQVGEDTIFIREYTCPYYDLAQDYRAICEMEESLMSQVLGTPVTLEACMMDGEHGCMFAISIGNADENVPMQDDRR